MGSSLFTLNTIITLCIHQEFLKCERVERKLEHWQKIIIHACQQCGRNQFPILHKPTPILEWIKKATEHTRLILDPHSNHTIKNILISNTVAFVIGPEGGLT